MDTHIFVNQIIAAYPKRNTWSWEKIVPKKNCFRFYELEMDQDLFGNHILKVRRGRIGQYSISRVVCVGSEQEIRAQLGIELARRLNHEYRLN